MTSKENYSKLTDQLVVKRIEQFGVVLNDKDKQRLIQGKLDRAQEALQARTNNKAWQVEA